MVDLYRYHVLTAQQAAALREPAETHGLLHPGTVTDRAGRPEVAISVDNPDGATRDVAIFDPTTGQLLSYEQVALLAPSASRVRPPALISFVLFLAHGHTNQHGQPANE